MIAVPEKPALHQAAALLTPPTPPCPEAITTMQLSSLNQAAHCNDDIPFLL